MGKATERLFLPLLRTIVHDIIDYDLPMFGAFHNCAFIKIRKEYPLQARRVMHSIWGAGQMAWTKTIFVVDEDVDVHDTTAVLRAATEHCKPARDVVIVDGPLDILDHAAPYLGAGGKIGFDATIKRGGELRPDNIPKESEVKPALELSAAEVKGILEAVRGLHGVLDASIPAALGHGWLFVRCDKAKCRLGRLSGSIQMAMEPPRRTTEQSSEYFYIAGVPYPAGWTPTKPAQPRNVIVVGADVDVQNLDETLFRWCANCDARRDLQILDEHPSHLSRFVWDATEKKPSDRGRWPVRDWPPLIRMSEDVRRRIAERESEFGL
jgi:3-polyprenyl-4-hydroxybenzoate decarboxylase